MCGKVFTHDHLLQVWGRMFIWKASPSVESAEGINNNDDITAKHKHLSLVKNLYGNYHALTYHFRYPYTRYFFGMWQKKGFWLLELSLLDSL